MRGNWAEENDQGEKETVEETRKAEDQKKENELAKRREAQQRRELQDEENERERLEEEEDKLIRDKTAYISLRNYDSIAGKNPDEVIDAFLNENPTELKPEFLLKTRMLIKIRFYSNQQRERAIEKKIVLFQQIVEIEAPREKVKIDRRTLYLYNIPIEKVGEEEIARGLKTRFPDIKIVSGFRFHERKGIKTGARTIIVEVQPKFEFPEGFAIKFSSFKSPTAVRLWHRNFPKRCRRCGAANHTTEFCTLPIENKTLGPYAAAVQYGRQRTTESNNEGFSSIVTMDTLTMLGTNSRVERRRPQAMSRTCEEATEQGMLENPATVDPTPAESATMKAQEIRETQYVPFFTKKYVYSNHYPSPFTCDGKDFKTAEHFLFYSKAKEMKMDEKAEEIRMQEEAGKAKQIGEKVAWNEESLGQWKTFAYAKLKQGNSLKYECNPELRKQLFETSP